MKTPKLTVRQLRGFMPRIPFNTLLGIELARIHDDGVTMVCPVRPDLLNSASVVHGGVAATIADVSVGVALNRHFGGKRPVTTVELKINYFRPVSQGKIFARARLLRIGSSICVGSVALSDSDRNSIGTAIVTYMILPNPPAPAK